MSIRRLENIAGESSVRGAGGRRVVGALLLLGVAGLALGNSRALDGEDLPRRHRFALRAPASLYERFDGSRHRASRERYAFYELAARFEGARLLLPKPLARRHGWYLERVAGLVVEVPPVLLPVPKLTARRSADFVGRLDEREVRFWTEPGADYALVERDEKGPLFWVPLRWLEPAP